VGERRLGKDSSDSVYFMSANRGKKSITVNLTHPEGQRLVRELVAKCDVLIENYKVATWTAMAWATRISRR